MVDHAKAHVGQRIRTIRKRHQYSLRTLAGLCGLSPNTISLIERGENSPTVSTLHLLATALDVPITDFFKEHSKQTTIFVRPEQRLRSEVSGIILESLGIGLSAQKLEPFLATIQPGAGSIDETVTHDGEEFVYCLSGEVEYQIADEIYHMQPGDSLLFEAAQPHCFRNVSEALAHLLMIFSASDEGHHLARLRHLDL